MEKTKRHTSARERATESKILWWEEIQVGPCLVHPKNQKIFKILRHIESYSTCMKH